MLGGEDRSYPALGRVEVWGLQPRVTLYSCPHFQMLLWEQNNSAGEGGVRIPGRLRKGMQGGPGL